jgi:hypothetical protein
MFNTLEKIERFHNRLSDQNFIWFPFGFLKPKPEQRIGIVLRLKMTFLFGPSFSAANAIRNLAFGRPIELPELAKSTLLVTAFFLVWFNIVTAYFWNRRANRLQSLKTEFNRH